MSETMEQEAPRQIIIPYTPRRWQMEMHQKLKRHNVLVVHRGGGKSVFAQNELIRRALSGPSRAEYVYLLPLRNQAQRNVWLPFKRFTDPIPYVKYNNATLEITLPNEAKIMVLGSDDPEKLRGLHLHGIVMDEYADMHPNIERAIMPMLTNHKGWTMYIGTPKGHNQFYRRYLDSQNTAWQDEWFGDILPHWKTKALAESEIESQRRILSPEEFGQEFECSFEAALVGAYYGRCLEEAREAHRISDVKLYRDDLEVNTAWDLGIRDRMAVWFFQLRDRDINFIDYEEHSNWGFPEWAEVIRQKERNYGFRYGCHIAPHDIKNRELGSGISRLESAEQVGISFEQCPKQDVMDGIELVRRHLPRCRFHSVMCADGLEALSMYRAKVDKAGQGLGPEHSIYSHAADSLRYAITHIVQVLQMPALVRMPFLRSR